MPDPLLKIDQLKKHFTAERTMTGEEEGVIKAVDGVSFVIYRGETFGLVGESGCGKSTLGLTILQLYEPTEGQVIFDGQDLTQLTTAELKPVRSKLQMIFQDPYASLDPRLTVEQIIREPLDIHKIGSKEERRQRVKELLQMVGMSPQFLNRYPHEFSGGQRQRIGIARAIALNPKFIICDEPVSALDVSVQGQILNLLRDLQEELNLTYLFIAHNLGVVAHISDRIGVMYLGKLVELGRTEVIMNHHRHPYTHALLSAIPELHKRRQKERIHLAGDVPSPLNPPPGCHFHPRCPIANSDCAVNEPVLAQVEEATEHLVACPYV